jgi:hypothetical protein
MKALSIKQPWAHLICTPRLDNPLLGIKDTENRTWQTHFRGKIYIHASGTPAKEPYKIFTDEQAQAFIDSDLDFEMLKSYSETSRIIGEVEIVDCVINHDSIWAEQTPIKGYTIEGEPMYEHKPTWNWVLANPVLYEKPILNVKGKLSFWDYKVQTCDHLNVERSDGLDECLDCGTKNH